MADMMRMASAMMALQAQAASEMAATKAALAAAGHGFGPELQDEIRAQAAAHQVPPDHDPNDPALRATAEEMSRKALEADYPEHGFEAADPRVAPIEGVTIVMAALAAKAIGWSPDQEFHGRVASALGLDPEAYARAAAGWRNRVTADIAIGAYYGQLFAQA